MAGPGATTEAFSALLSRDFNRSHELLASIAKQLGPGSKSRVDHNAAVVNLYAAGGPGSPDAQPHIRDLVLAAVSAIPEADRPRSVDQFFSETTKDRAALNTVLSACGGVHLYNLAVIAYNSDRINAAASLGQVLYANIEAMEDWLALRSCFLLIDVYLRLDDLSHAVNAQVHAEQLILGFSDGKEESASAASPNDKVQSTLFPVAPNWKGKTASVIEPPVSFEDAKFCMRLYNARIGSALEISGKPANPSTFGVEADEDTAGRSLAASLLVKARLESDAKEGMKTLASIKTKGPEETYNKVLPIMLNTFGVLHHRIGKHAMAAFYFHQAREAFLKAVESKTEAGQGWEGGNKDDDVSLSVTRAPHDTHVTYNLGLQYMKMGVYQEALGLFSLCARSDKLLASTSPRLWIRMAECCVAEANNSYLHSQGVDLEGRGRGRRLVLWTLPYEEKKVFSYASICARAALSILDQMKEKLEGQDDEDANSKGREEKGSEAKEEASLRCVALAILAYALLEVDAKMALDACNDLVDVSSSIDSERAVLGRLYGAEALCMLGRPNDAVERLAPLLALRAQGHASIRDGAFVNVALAHSMRGDMTTAVRAAKAALKVTGGQDKKETPRREALLVASYVFLREGDVANARTSLHSLRVIPTKRRDRRNQPAS